MTPIVIAFRAPAPTIEALRGIAQSEGVSIATVVRWAVQEWAEREGVDIGDGLEAGIWRSPRAPGVKITAPVPLRWRKALLKAAGSSALMPALMASIVADYLRGQEKEAA